MRIPSTVHSALLALAVVVLTTGCDQSPTAPSAPTGGSTSGRTVTILEVTGPTVVGTGETPRYKAFAQYSDGTRQDVTETVQWTPGAPPGAPPQTSGHSLCFTSPGVALGVRPGETTVTVFHGMTMATRLTVGVVDPGTFEVTGVVTESGAGPLPGATVTVTTGRGQSLQTRTDADGRYGIYGVAGQVEMRVSADGFAPQVLAFVVAAHGASHHVELAPLEAAADATGVWTMTIAPSPTCRGGLPEIARAREYQIEFTQRGSRLESRLSGPTLTVHFTQPRIGTVLGSRLRLQLPGDSTYDGWTSPDIYDRLSPTEQFGFVGTLDGVVSGSAIRGTLDGDLLYFNSETDRNEPTWYCRAQDHVVVLRR